MIVEWPADWPVTLGGEGQGAWKVRLARRAKTSAGLQARRRESHSVPRGSGETLGKYSTATVRPIEQSVSSAPNWNVLPWVSVTSPV